MQRYKPIFEENQKLTEMALVGRTKGLVVQVYTDHAPMHFHLVKKDKYEARIKIHKELPSDISELEILNYKFQKSDTDIVTNQDLRNLLFFLKETSKINDDSNNFKMIQALWKALNPK